MHGRIEADAGCTYTQVLYYMNTKYNETQKRSSSVAVCAERLIDNITNKKKVSRHPRATK
jgi:hypothetical protein